MPEGDTLHRIAGRLAVLVGDRIEAESPHPRGRLTGVAPRIDGRRLESVEAVGKNLFLRFEDGVTVRSHLRMRGRWQLRPRRLSGSEPLSKPWLVLRGVSHEAMLWNGPVLEVVTKPLRLGPDILTGDLTQVRLRGPIGEALLDQRQVAGIGNSWRCEALWHARVSPWANAADTDQQQLLATARRLMAERAPHRVYRRPVCPRCGTRIRARGQGDENRTAYWCPSCQAGPQPPGE